MAKKRWFFGKELLTSEKLRGPWYEIVCFLKLHIYVYLHATFEVSSVILTKFSKQTQIRVKSKTVAMSWNSRRKEEGIICTVYFPKQNFLRFVFYLNAKCIEYTFRIYIFLHIFIQTLLHKLLLLVFKIIESLQYILKCII